MFTISLLGDINVFYSPHFNEVAHVWVCNMTRETLIELTVHNLFVHKIFQIYEIMFVLIMRITISFYGQIYIICTLYVYNVTDIIKLFLNEA